MTRILYVAFPDSIHTARWINQVARRWDTHLFPVYGGPVARELTQTTVHVPHLGASLPFRRMLARGKRAALGYVRATRPQKPTRRAEAQPACTCPKQDSNTRHNRPSLFGCVPGLANQLDPATRLAKVIDRIQPDLIHTLEIQHAGYLMSAARDLVRGTMPPWIVSNWGSDIYHFGRQAKHAPRIREVLGHANAYTCECQRDVALGHEFGFQGEVWPVLPAAGGVNLDHVRSLRSDMPTSQRKVILLKGYEGWAGRALSGIEALRSVALKLSGYQIRVYNAQHSPDVRLALGKLARDTGLDVDIISSCSHDEMLAWHGRARVSIGLSTTDGISTSALEAITMGSVPVQTNTSCLGDWITDGQSGLLVPPEDIAATAAAIERAVQDDELADQAAEMNWQTVGQRLDEQVVQTQVIAAYEQTLSNSQSRQAA